MQRVQFLLSHLIACVLGLSLVINANAGGFPQRLIEGQLQPSLAPIIENSAPAVVNIATYTIQRQYNPLLQSPFFRHFFSLPDEIEESREVQSAGSGVIVDANNGYILTNHHVIADSNDIEVKLQDGRQFKATLVGSDKKVDIALLKIEADKLSSIKVANSNSLAVGDFVIAIGNPFGIGQTVTTGIVSALGRNGLGIQGYEDFIQTDASINPGNSGGALIDLNGNLVGINSAIIAPAGGNIGIGFAIPTEVSQSVMSQLIRFGEVKRGGIGARFQDLSPELAEAFSFSGKAQKTYQGAIVSNIEKGSAADHANLKQGDIITRANGRSIRSANDIQNRIGLSSIGQTLELEIIRDGNSKVIEVEIQVIPVPEIPGDKLSSYLSGAQLMDLIPSDQEEAVGIQVKELISRSIAQQLGFELGDIIYAVNRTRVRNIAELKSYLRQRKVQAFRVRRGYEDLTLYVR
jgi:Do/DeqQ family serine protease